MTLRVDKKELEDLAKANESLKAAGFAVVFDSNTFVSNLGKKSKKKKTRAIWGKLVTFDSFDTTDKEGAEFIKVRSPVSGKESEVATKKVVMLDKREMLKSSGPNALRRYTRRHQEILAKLKEMQQYSESLEADLGKIGNRPPARLLSF